MLTVLPTFPSGRDPRTGRGLPCADSQPALLRSFGSSADPTSAVELLKASSVRSPYQAPELRQAGHLGSTTDGYQLAGVLQAVAERAAQPLPSYSLR